MTNQAQPSKSAKSPGGLRPPQRRSLLIIGLPLLALVACGVAVYALIGSWLGSAFTPLAQYYGADYDRLQQALAARWDTDNSIPSASSGIDLNGFGDNPGAWLVIEISYTGACASTPPDPCDRLANDLARIVLENYGKVDDLTGIGVVIGNKPHKLSIPESEVIFKKYLTVPEWRKVLDIRQ